MLATSMDVAIVGLGKMGGNMARRLLRAGVTVVAFDRDGGAVAQLAAEGARGASSLKEAVALLAEDGVGAKPRVVWVMVPSGAPTEAALTELGALLGRGDVVVDGGNSNFRDTKRRAASLASQGITLLDAGTSGGVWGLENGYCLMVGGDAAAFAVARPIFERLAPEGGLAHVGVAGAGHFAKMVHNGIEYAMMQAYAEGFDLLRASEYGYDLRALTGVWQRGSVVRSWLLDLAHRAFVKDPELSALKDYVEDSGEGRWTVNEAVAHAVPVPTIAASLFARFASRQESSFAMRFVAALRGEFGGHAVKKA